jgi:hypothetical protein
MTKLLMLLLLLLSHPQAIRFQMAQRQLKNWIRKMLSPRRLMRQRKKVPSEVIHIKFVKRKMKKPLLARFLFLNKCENWWTGRSID